MGELQIAALQQALRDEKLDGWLFFDHHGRDPLAYRILQFQPARMCTRRWYYFVPAQGEPRKLVHAIEPGVLDALPGTATKYASWERQVYGIRSLVGGAKRVAMQYSPECAVPYVAMVDAGTVELVRSLGVEVMTSANLVQYFEARWTQEKLDSHLAAGKLVDEVRQAAFDEIAFTLSGRAPIDEFRVKSFILKAFDRAGLFTDHGPIVAVNEHASDPHYEPFADSTAPIQQGDLVLIDLWAKLNQPGSVYYDITWTGFIGDNPPSEMDKVFDVVAGARDKAITRVVEAIALKKSLCGFEVDDACRNHIREHGYGDFFIHRTGHSIGEDVHGSGANMDNLETHDIRKVIPWTCFSIEPGIYLPNFGVRSEVNVFVGEHEAMVTGEKQAKLLRVV